MPRFFTLEQARAQLPRVKTLLARAVESKAEYQVSEAWSHEFVRRIMMQGGLLVDRAPFERNRERQNRSAERIKSSVEEIHALGILVKDLDLGLIDFPTLLRGKEVYLCWRMGEEELLYWHAIEDGFAGRRIIDQEFVDNHRGREAE